MVKFFPELKDIAQMKPPPTEGESFLLNFFEKYLGGLSGEFEVFFQAHWDGGFPDFVIMRKNHGILIIEVKDWNLDSYTFNNDEEWTVKSNDQRVRSPIAQVKYYKNLFYDTYSRTLAEENLRNGKIFSLVQAAVFFYGSTKAQVDKIKPKDEFTIFLTQEELEQNGLKNIPQANFFLGHLISTFFKDDIYNELHRVLKPSEHSLSKIFFPKTLDKNQQRLVQSSADSKNQVRRQLRAPAGSGKTTVLVFRAVDAFRKTNEPVLILTYNITLCNYIRDCLSQALNSLPNIKGRKNYLLKNFFLTRHFHGFIKDYRAKNNQFDITKYDDTGNVVDTGELTATPQKFQTIFVDETQDFHRNWMETIVSLLKPTGELIFFGDWDQDLYKVRQRDNVPTGKAGVLKLKATYRLRSKIFDLAHAFQKNFLKGGNDGEINTPPASDDLFGEYSGDAATVQYYFFDLLDVNAIFEIFKSTLKEYTPPNDDICILSQVIRNVRPVDEILRDKGYKTMTTFEKEEDWLACHNKGQDWKINNIRQAAKYGFQMESGKIKLATIQSYKGWGIHTEILIIGNGFVGEKFLNDEMVYTGITRAKKNLIVINIGDRTYDEFFRTESEDFSVAPTLTEEEKISLAGQKFAEAFKLAEGGDNSGAIKLYTEAIELNPNLIQAYNNRGNTYKNLGDYHRAIQDYDKAIELNPNFANAYCGRGIAYKNSGDYHRAIQNYDKAIELNPNFANAYYNRGIAYKNSGDYHRAIADFNKYAALNPSDAADAYKMLGECYQALAEKSTK
ncbi:MAG: tetratricopeptide repeat protein [Selenomonadaceae bacterium]|nr:tetratricopeptide repeat protein [Selenomonadaceae bacterium]